MNVTPKNIIALLVGCILSLAACHINKHQPLLKEALRDNDQPDKQMPLIWMRNGKHIFIGKRWVFNRVAKTFTQIARPDAVHEDPNSWRMIPSPDGKHLLWSDANQQLVIGKITEANDKVYQIPSWFSDMTTVVNVPFWLNNGVFIQQIDVAEPCKRACKYFNVETEQWYNLHNDECIDASFSPIGMVDCLSDQTYMVYSASEGINGLDIIKIFERNMVRQEPQGSMAFLQTPVPIQVRLNTPTKACLIFPCELDIVNTVNELDIDCAEKSKGWAIYEWTLKDESLKNLEIRRRNLPTGIVMSPKDDELFAWLDNGTICIGKPYDDGTIHCTALPYREENR